MSKRILIIKTSSIGDILQSFYVLPFLKMRGLVIDFVVDHKHKVLALAHPFIDKVILSDIDGWTKRRKKNISFSFFRKELQTYNYEMVFDLQRNWKSSVILFFTKAKRKIGYGKASVREKINLLFTNEKYDITKNTNIRLFYFSLFEKVFPHLKVDNEKVFFSLTDREKKILEHKKRFFSSIKKQKILVSMGSSWTNKVPQKSFILSFLKKIDHQFPVFFFFSYGTENEKEDAKLFSKRLSSAQVIEKTSFALWQHLIEEMDLLIATDSSILSLAQMTNTHSFSFFGPTMGDVFAPIENRTIVQGSCPYKINFEKQCPKLRSCKSGACIKDLEVNSCFQFFIKWYEQNITMLR